MQPHVLCPTIFLLKLILPYQGITFWEKVEIGEVIAYTNKKKRILRYLLVILKPQQGRNVGTSILNFFFVLFSSWQAFISVWFVITFCRDLNFLCTFG